MFEKIKEKYKNSEYKMLIARVIDKYNYCLTKNKITYTDFLNLTEKTIIENILNTEKVKNKVFFGGNEENDRNVLFFYPDKIDENMLKKNYEKILSVIRIKLPDNVVYEHREYLSGIMKLGIRREKFGDIIITDFGADIIVLDEICDTLINDLKSLTRFKKSEIKRCSINEVSQKIQEFQEIYITVSSLRLDGFVSEIVKTSRSKAIEIINGGRVYLNYINEYKTDKKINENDIINIRGNGKYVFDSIERITKNNKLYIKLKKYI